jgi:hypothetical protein
VEREGWERLKERGSEKEKHLQARESACGEGRSVVRVCHEHCHPRSLTKISISTTHGKHELPEQEHIPADHSEIDASRTSRYSDRLLISSGRIRIQLLFG